MHATLNAKRQQGAGLISVILALFIMGIVVMSFSSFIQPLAVQPIQIIEQKKALNLAKSLMQEISFKRFDERLNTPNKPRCIAQEKVQNTHVDATKHQPAPCSNVLGPEEARPFYNDVDDYHGFNETMTLSHSQQTYAQAYPNYKVQVQVKYISQHGELSNKTTNTKLIDLVVTTPRGKRVQLQSLKGNY